MSTASWRSPIGSAGPTRRNASFELGCGVGRLTSALANHFTHAVGVDISTSMIAQAEVLHAELKNCEWVAYDGHDLERFPDHAFDLVLSFLVLQHVPTRTEIVCLLGELARLTAPGGLLVVQLPASMPVRQRLQLRRRAYALLRRLGISDALLYRRFGLHPIRMNWVPRRQAEEAIRRGGLQILDVMDGWLGDRTAVGREVNVTYVATRDV
jgi:ubiquinone/menaquinone biosynthesis C-methylase UbiE